MKSAIYIRQKKALTLVVVIKHQDHECVHNHAECKSHFIRQCLPKIRRHLVLNFQAARWDEVVLFEARALCDWVYDDVSAFPAAPQPLNCVLELTLIISACLQRNENFVCPTTQRQLAGNSKFPMRTKTTCGQCNDKERSDTHLCEDSARRPFKYFW